MGTAAIPDADPLPPLLPTTVGWRWPWLLATLAFTLTAGWLFVRTLPMALEFGTDSDSQYTAWVYSPRASVFFLSFAAGIITMIVLSFRRWRQPTRNVIVAVFALASLASSAWAGHESAARRHVGPALVAAVKSVPRPAGATSLAPVVVDSATPIAYLDLLGEPSAGQEWQLGTDTEAAACSAERQMVAGQGGWQPWGICGFRRVHGRVVVIISEDAIRSSTATIDVSAYPND